MLRLMVFDRFDQPVCELSEEEVFGLVRTEKVNGEHSLAITTSRVLEQGWRILTCDARGKWREHVVYGNDAAHEAGDRPVGDYYCVWSLQADLMGTRVSSMPGVVTPVTAGVALGCALEGTERWQVGTVTNTNTNGASMYDTDGWSAMSTLIENWGGEIDVTIGVGSAGVVSRSVDYYSKQGEQEPKRRYDFGADLTAVRRRIADGPLYCRITPRGRGEETGDGYGRKITIEDVNDGKDYLEYAPMVDLAKLPDGEGGWEYPTLEVENSECETPADLKAWAQTVLEESTVPQITYEADVLQLAREGIDMHGVSLGDAVHIVDRRFGDGMRVSGRVLQMAVNLLDEDDVQIVMGSIAENLATLVGGMDSRIRQVTATVQAMNGGTMSAAGYLGRLLDRINAEINSTGGYTYIVQGHGLLTYDTAVSDPTVGAEASSVVELKGGTIRIANTKTAQGEWEWKTVFTSGHILADLVTAAKITTGYIGSSNDTFIDLDNSIVRFGPNSGRHVKITDIGLSVYSGSTSVISHLGYGNSVAEDGSTEADPYTTLGTRYSGSNIGAWSIAAGKSVYATKFGAHAEGAFTKAYGNCAHAEGYGCTASGKYSHAEGHNSVASGDYSHAEGQWGNTGGATGKCSHAEGYSPNASGDYSHAEGSSCTASGNYSHAGGAVAQAVGDYSFAHGRFVFADSANQFIIGKYYRSASSDVFAIGNGSSSSYNALFVVGSSQTDINSKLDVSGRLLAHNDFTCIGTKSRLAGTEGYGDRLLYCYETASPMFGDIGSGALDGTGCCYVQIDPVFAETARTDIGYQVFLQACGRGEVWVDEKAPTHFVVRGTPGLAFDWEVKAKQAGYEQTRLEDDFIGTSADDEMLYHRMTEPDYDDEQDDIWAMYADEMESLLADAVMEIY